MLEDSALSLVFLVFFLAGTVICVCGVKMTGLADLIADRTGLGEAIVGGLLLGAATSLSGTVVSVSAAWENQASLAFSNSVGGIAAQTAFLALADLMFRKANLEHAAAEVTNIVQGILLLMLLTLPFAARLTPDITLFAIHPVSVAIPAIYVIGMFISRAVREDPMWTPVRTPHTRTDTPDEEDHGTEDQSNFRVFGEFAVLMAAMGLSGWFIEQSGSALAQRLDISTSLVGALMTAIVTSLPELVTTLAAVRRGALQLAVGGIIGGNMFDMLFLPAADIAYRDGSLYHAATNQDYFWVASAMLMTTALLAGLVVRERRGPAGIGFDSMSLLIIYAGTIALQMTVF